MTKPIISCITPTFNRAHLLKNAIESTLAQTYLHWEMIIVDDGSTDNTKEIATAYCQKDNRIKYFKNIGKGANAARNYGIRQSKGQYIVFLDDDDEHLPHRFESQLNAVKKSSSKFILSGYMVVDHKTRKILSRFDQGLHGMGAGIGIRWIVERELLFKAGLFDETMPSLHEVELSYRIAKYEIFANHRDIVAVVLNNTTSSISKGIKGLKGKLLVVEKHKDKMHPLEAAWWYYTIGSDYYRLNDLQKALKYLIMAAALDSRGIYRIAYQYSRIFFNLGRPFNKINNKILQLLSAYRYPKLVDHLVIE